MLNGPRQGVLELGRDTEPVRMFTQGDIENSRLSYRHNGDVTSVQDQFQLRVSVEGASTHAEFSIRVFPAGYWDPLLVSNNQTLHVEESTSVVISTNYLQVSIFMICMISIFLLKMYSCVAEVSPMYQDI